MSTGPSRRAAPGVCGKAEEAIDFYVSVFQNARRGTTIRNPDAAGTLMFADFAIDDQWFAVMDSAHPHDFAFNEAVSLLVRCKDQAEIDHHWHQLSAVPAAEQCGWLKDRFGVSWQIAPAEMVEMMREADEQALARLTRAFLPMKKFDVAALRKAYTGN